MNAPNISSKSALAGLMTAVVGSLCCITPVFSLLAGVGGIAATFSWMDPFRPYLIALTIGVLGFAWYQKLKPVKDDEIQCDCEATEKTERPSFWQSRKFLGMVTVLAVLMLAFPSFSHVFYTNPDYRSSIMLQAQDSTKTYQIVLNIKGMTCLGCESHVIGAISELEGIKDVKASFENGNATVKFNPEKVSQKEIEEAINKTGYKVITEPAQD